MLQEIVYRSTAVHLPPTPVDLEILTVSEQRNDANGITGYLLREGRYYLQLLEGPEQAVEAVYKVIKEDHRHVNVTLLTQGPKMDRDFSSWKMGYSDVSIGATGQFIFDRHRDQTVVEYGAEQLRAIFKFASQQQSLPAMESG